MSSLYFSGGAVRFQVDDEDGIRRLREALGQLLQVNQLCVLVGSGASFHLGSPRIRKVGTSQIKEMCDSAGMPLDADAEKVLNALVAGEADLEDVLGQLAASLAYAQAFGQAEVDITGLRPSRAEVQGLFGSINVALAVACDLPRPGAALPPPYDDDPWYSHREFFRRLIGSRRPDAPRVRVFTTNYDTVIERSLDDCGIYYLDGFVGGVERALALASYDNDVYAVQPSSTGSLLRLHDLLHLYKLHGSTNWRAQPSPAGFGTLRIVQTAAPPSADNVAVIYPTPTKEFDVLGHPYADLLRIFGTSLAIPECVLFVTGYGFGDEHINRLIYQAMAYNSTLQLFVADPFGIVEANAPVVDGEVDRLDTPVGGLSQVKDARITMLSGEAARFSNLALALPDVADRTPAEQTTLNEALAIALLSSFPPPAGGTSPEDGDSGSS